MINTSRSLCRINFCFAFAVGLLAVASLSFNVARAADKPVPSKSAAADASSPESKAWTELREAMRSPSYPEAWKTNRPSREEYQAFMLKQSDQLADKVAEFLAKFPDGAHAREARKLQVSILQVAAMVGNDKRAAELSAILAKTAADKSLPDDDRVAARITQAQLEARKASGQAAMIKTMADGLLAIQKDFPKSQLVYDQLMRIVNSAEEPDTMKRIAKVIVQSPDAPEKYKQKAQDVLDGKIFLASANIGKPVDIKFTAVDGTKVDLAKLKGKVVLIDFWATWCGPCVAEIPHVREAYEKYHDKGFDIIGISFDRQGDKEKLIKFTKSKDMPWPQYFDGKYWDNEFGQRFNIHSIPTMWLFDKNGNLADANAREDLAGKVAKLLEAK